jgi:hypothetical protein
MTALAQLLLVLTCLAPIAAVYAGVLAGNATTRGTAWCWVALVVFLVTGCLLLLWWVRRRIPPVPLLIANVATKEAEPLAFLVAYALPLATSPDKGSPTGIAVFAAVMALVLWQQQIFHVNPLLAMLGFHFFSATSNAGASVLVVSRSRVLGSGVLSVVRLSDYLWLDSGKLLPSGDDGSAASDTT